MPVEYTSFSDIDVTLPKPSGDIDKDVEFATPNVDTTKNAVLSFEAKGADRMGDRSSPQWGHRTTTNADSRCSTLSRRPGPVQRQPRASAASGACRGGVRAPRASDTRRSPAPPARARRR